MYIQLLLLSVLVNFKEVCNELGEGCSSIVCNTKAPIVVVPIENNISGINTIDNLDSLASIDTDKSIIHSTGILL